MSFGYHGSEHRADIGECRFMPQAMFIAPRQHIVPDGIFIASEQRLNKRLEAFREVLRRLSACTRQMECLLNGGVVTSTQLSRLPVFLWAIRKPYKKFYYFKYGLIERAKKRGINL